MSKYRQPRKSVVAAFRVPEDLYIKLMARVAEEDLDFSKLVRRALRREMANQFLSGSEERVHAND